MQFINKNTTLDNFLIISLMLATIAPVNYAKLLVLVFNSLILIRIFKDKAIFFDTNRILIFLLIVPGIMLTAINAPQELVRFAVILILIFRYPFPELKLNKKIIMYFSITILFYLIFTQILISYKIDRLVSFRDIWYSSNYSHVLDSQTFFDFTQYQSLLNIIGNIRSGGLFHNPNVLGMLVLLYFFIYDACYSSLKTKNRLIYILVNLFTITSLLLTFSRTAIGGFIIYHFIKQTDFKRLVPFKVSKRSIPIYIFLSIIAFNMKDAFIETFLTTESSGYLKFSIFSNYLKNSNIFTILFGGTHDVFFDTELGNWIGAVGLIGLIGLILLFKKIYRNNKFTLAFFITFMFMSIGNTIIYGLLTVNVVYVYFLILSNNVKNNFHLNSK